MKSPEIDPELHGLLDEVVHDPRSALRRTPRRALMEWFANPTAAHARPVDTTTAERHLVAVYKESLAELLLKASWLAFHGQPTPRMLPRYSNGSPVDMEKEAAALRHAVGRVPELDYGCVGRPDAIALLVSQSLALDCSQAAALSALAVALVPSDFGRLRWAVALPDAEWRTSVLTLQRLANEATAPYVRKDAHNAIAIRMVEQGWLHLARGEYRLAIQEYPQLADTRFWSFNLACWAGDKAEALEQADAIQQLSRVEDDQIRQAVEVLRFWALRTSPEVVRPILRSRASWASELPEQCRRLLSAYP